MADSKLGMSLDAIIAQSRKPSGPRRSKPAPARDGKASSRNGSRASAPAGIKVGDKKYVLVGSRKNLQVKVNVPAMQQAQKQTQQAAEGTGSRSRRRRGGGNMLQAVQQEEQQQYLIPVQRGGVQKRTAQASFRAPTIVQQYAPARQLPNNRVSAAYV